MSHLEFTFSIDPYNKNSSLVDFTRCSKANFLPPLRSTTLELEITILVMKENESLSLKASIIK